MNGDVDLWSSYGFACVVRTEETSAFATKDGSTVHSLVEGLRPRGNVQLPTEKKGSSTQRKPGESSVAGGF